MELVGVLLAYYVVIFRSGFSLSEWRYELCHVEMDVERAKTRWHPSQGQGESVAQSEGISEQNTV